jgi:hypothetical protein
MRDNKPLSLTRQDLYELAWSKPMSELAKDFGISDVGLANRCRRLGIPAIQRASAAQPYHRDRLVADLANGES